MKKYLHYQNNLQHKIHKLDQHKSDTYYVGTVWSNKLFEKFKNIFSDKQFVLFIKN